MDGLAAMVVSAGVAGVLDLAGAAAFAHSQGTSTKRMLQFVASGVLGPEAFQRDEATGLGLVLHFVVALGVAGTYLVLVLMAPDVLGHPFAAGAGFGIAVHLVMSRVVLPLSRTPKRPFAWSPFLWQAAIHIVCVGIPIALTMSYLLRRHR